MKKRTIALLFGGLLAAQADFVYRSGSAFLTTADLDGDGRSDLVLVDGPAATVRVGYQLSAGTLTWAPLRSFGLDNVTGVACGTVQYTTHDSIIVTAPSLNRLNVYEAPTTTTQLVPVAAYGNGVGPYTVSALDVGGTGNTLHDDLVSITTLNGTSPFRVERIRASGGSLFSSIGQSAIGSAWRHLNSVEYGTGPDGMALIDALNAGYLRLYDFSTGSPIQKGVVALTGMTQPSYVSFRHASGDAHFVLWEQGNSTIRTTTLVAGGGSYAFSSPLAYGLSAPVESIFLVQGGGTNRLAVVYPDGSSELFDHDGSGAPVSLQNFLPPVGERFSGFLPINDDDFIMFSSAGTNEASLTVNQMHFSGGTFSSVGSQSLSSAIAGNGRANVMTFAAEPFVDSSPQRLQLLRAGDWSTAVSLGPNVSVTYESDLGWQQGLGNEQTGTLGTAAAGAAYTLDNQFHSAISIHSFDPARGEEAFSVSVSPEPGIYGTSIDVLLSPSPGSSAYYRTDSSNAWTLYSIPFTLFADTDVQYYAKSAAKHSIIQTAVFRFSDTPSDLDSDGDGIPDYVEIANGLDPSESGMDGDGDGYSDLDELLAGSSPTNAAGIPANSNRFERAAVYDQVLTPYTYDGIYNKTRKSRVGTQVRLFSASGAQYGYAQTEHLSIGVATTNPAALFEAVPLSLNPPFVTAITDTRFDVYNTFSGNQYGIEQVGIYQQPDPDASTVDYTYQGGNLATEANGWISAALDFYTNQTRGVQVADLSLTNTLSALLVERKLADLLFERDTITNNWVSLFKGRTADGTMEGLSLFDIQSLESQGPGNEPAYLVSALISSIHEEVPSQIELLELTEDLYDLRSYYGRFAVNAGKYPLPIDVLRSFLYTGVIHSNYMAHASISPTEVALAYAEAVQTLAQVEFRSVDFFVLEVQADSFATDCPVLYTGGNMAKSLYTAEGNPFRFPSTFTLQPGAQVSVEAFTDPDWNLCPGTDPLEIISLALTAVPTASGTDADGNLLPDDYEELFLVGSGGLATSDLDGDGFSDLQEYLEQTDPNDILNYPGVDPVDFSAPLVQISTPMVGQAQLDIDWPAAYADEFVFTVMQSTNLTDTAFAEDVELTSGSLSESMDTTGNNAAFYQVEMKLR